MKRINLGLIGLSAIGAIISGYALASPPHPFERTYYSDASHTVVVGYQNQGCWHSTHSGQYTPYYDEIEYEEIYC